MLRQSNHPSATASSPVHPHPQDCLHCEHRHLRVFCNLTPEALEQYDRIGILMNFERGAKLFSEGDPVRNIYVICHGQVKISSVSRSGRALILKIAGPGDLMGLSAALADVPYEVSAEVIESCQVKVIRRQEFLDLLEQHGVASMRAAQSLSSAYMTVFYDAKRLALSNSAAGRLARVLLDWGRAVAAGRAELKFTMTLTHEELANMAGISRETVTRLLSQFRRDQWVNVRGSSMTILQPDQLEKLTV